MVYQQSKPSTPRPQLWSTSKANHLYQGPNFGLPAKQTIFAKAPTMVYQQSKQSLERPQLWSTSRVKPSIPRLQPWSTSRVNRLCQGPNYGLPAEQTIYTKAPTMVYQQSKPSMPRPQLWSTSRAFHLYQGSNYGLQAE